MDRILTFLVRSTDDMEEWFTLLERIKSHRFKVVALDSVHNSVAQMENECLIFLAWREHAIEFIKMVMENDTVFKGGVAINPVYESPLRMGLSRIEVPLLFVSGNDEHSEACRSATAYHDLVSGSSHARLRCPSSEINTKTDQLISAILQFLDRI